MTPHDSLQQSRSPLDKWWGVYGPALLRIKRDTEHYLAVTALAPLHGGRADFDVMSRWLSAAITVPSGPSSACP